MGFNILGQAFHNQPLLIAILAPGAFILMGFIMGLFNILESRGGGS
jgi:Na+-translocating ferredoxin:NAD+ oxidoreductase RnfE subunit